VIAAAATIVLAVTGSSGSAGGAPCGLPLAPLSALGALQPAPARMQPGPKVWASCHPTLRLATAAIGQPVGQISGQTGEQTLFHIQPTGPSFERNGTAVSA
jgi:hypothetical protein